MNSQDKLWLFWTLISVFLAVALIFIPLKNEKIVKERDLKNIDQLIKGFGDNLKKVDLTAPENVRNNLIDQYYKDYLTPQLLETFKKESEKALGRIVSSPWPEKIEIDALSMFKDKALVDARIIEMTSLGKSNEVKITLELILKDQWARKWLISNITIKEAEENLENQENNEPVSLENPAAVFCQNQGYRYEIRENPDGSQYGVCIFNDNNECEEWAFYRKECGLEYLKETQNNEDCAKEGERVNRNPLLGPTDKKCCPGLIEERVSRSYSICRALNNKSEEMTCKNLCGDGICQEIVCLAVGCPCPETPQNCPQDCH